MKKVSRKTLARVGQKYHSLTIMAYQPEKKGTYYWCKCDCGREKSIRYESIRAGLSKRCGNCGPPKNSKHHSWKGCGEISKGIWTPIIWSAKARNIPFDITIEDAWKQYQKQNGKCALTGRQLQFAKTYDAKHQRTASLDRIDSSKGYTIDNIQWVHRELNYFKSNYSEEELISLCKEIIRYRESTDSKDNNEIL